MSKSSYYTEWRSTEQCRAMRLDEDMVLPTENGDALGALTVATFTAGDYEVRQHGRVFGRTAIDHEARFAPVVNRARKGGE